MKDCFFSYIHSRSSYFLSKFFFIPFLYLFTFSFYIYSNPQEDNALLLDTTALPLIKEFNNKDATFTLLSRDIEENDKLYYKYKRKSKGDSSSPPYRYTFYKYQCKEKDNLIALSAATNIPYDSIASINSLSNINLSLTGRTLILPSVKGLYVSFTPKSNIDILVYKEYSNIFLNNRNETNSLYTIIKNSSSGNKYILLPGFRYTPTQRAYFLDSGFRLPLDNIRVSSEFGYRVSPVYNKWKEHKGIDFAAPIGKSVYACKSGVASNVYYNDGTFGNYIILSHNNGYTSVYAHLSKILVKRGESVTTRQVIGQVGKTGMVTGPHLHFELRLKGEAKNPREILNIK